VFRLDPELWTLRADPGQLHQVLMNLVVNAREAMPGGGLLTIETRNASEPTGDFVRLSVSDTGVGMDDRTRRHVFEPFFTTKSMSKGNGLGLATVFGVVTQAGGHLAVSSEPGKGSVFSLSFPRLNTPAHPDAGNGVERPAPRTSGAVLLVEDEAEVRRLAGVILGNMGFTVLEAGDAGQAINQAKRFDGEIRLMLTDVIMPGMNGRELADRMGELRPQTKVIFMSGYTDRIMTRDGILDDSVAYLQKPFTAEQLSATVYRVLRVLE
jgi:two-component system, cell cycle sensor histidine kinase and response regulator CckA